MTDDPADSSGEAAAFSGTPALTEVIDRREALERAGDDAEFLDELLRIFRDDAPAMLQRLDDAAGDADPRALERAAHSVKGATGTISAHAVSALAADVERLARATRTAEAHARLLELRRAFAQLVRALDAALGRKAA